MLLDPDYAEACCSCWCTSAVSPQRCQADSVTCSKHAVLQCFLTQQYASTQSIRRLPSPQHQPRAAKGKAAAQAKQETKEKRSDFCSTLQTCRSPVEQHVQLLQWHNKPQQNITSIVCMWECLPLEAAAGECFTLEALPPPSHAHTTAMVVGPVCGGWAHCPSTLAKAMHNPALNIAARKHAIKFISPSMCKAHGMSWITRCMSGLTTTQGGCRHVTKKQTLAASPAQLLC